MLTFPGLPPPLKAGEPIWFREGFTNLKVRPYVGRPSKSLFLGAPFVSQKFIVQFTLNFACHSFSPLQGYKGA